MIGTSTRKLDSAIRQIHSCVGADERWDDALCQIRELLRGRSAAFARHDFATGCSEPLFESPSSPSLLRAHSKGHTVGSPWFLSSMDYQAGRVMTGDELVARADLMRSDFYRRFLASRGLVHWLCGVVSRNSDVVHYVAVHRAKTQTAFNAHDKDLLASLLEHLTIAVQNHWAFLSERSTNSTLRDVIDGVSAAAFVVDDEGMILLQNHAADIVLDAHQELVVVDSHLVSRSSVATSALRRAIANAAAEHAPDDDRAEQMVDVGDEASEHPFFVSIRYGGSLFCTQSREYRHTAIVLANKTDHRARSEQCMLAKVYRFTPAQARLSGLMLSGLSRRDAAKTLDVSENTIRSHLKQIYAKTNTHGLMDLVQLHARVCTDH